MRELSKVELRGNLVKDPVVNWRENGIPVAALLVAVHRDIVHPSGSVDRWTDYLDVIVEGDLAETIPMDFKKSMRVHVLGRLVQQRWGRPGSMKCRLVVDASSLNGIECGVYEAGVCDAEA